LTTTTPTIGLGWDAAALRAQAADVAVALAGLAMGQRRHRPVSVLTSISPAAARKYKTS